MYRVHDINTSGLGHVDLKYSQANMSAQMLHWQPGMMGVISLEAPSGALLGATQHSLLASAASHYGCFLACPEPFVALSLSEGPKSLGIAVSHTEDATKVENRSFLKEMSR